MKRYRITVSYRPHASSLKRETAAFTITARNKQVAILRAGWIMHLEHKYHVAESLTITVVPL